MNPVLDSGADERRDRRGRWRHPVSVAPREDRCSLPRERWRVSGSRPAPRVVDVVGKAAREGIHQTCRSVRSSRNSVGATHPASIRLRWSDQSRIPTQPSAARPSGPRQRLDAPPHRRVLAQDEREHDDVEAALGLTVDDITLDELRGRRETPGAIEHRRGPVDGNDLAAVAPCSSAGDLACAASELEHPRTRPQRQPGDEPATKTPAARRHPDHGVQHVIGERERRHRTRMRAMLISGNSHSPTREPALARCQFRIDRDEPSKSSSTRCSTSSSSAATQQRRPTTSRKPPVCRSARSTSTSRTRTRSSSHSTSAISTTPKRGCASSSPRSHAQRAAARRVGAAPRRGARCDQRVGSRSAAVPHLAARAGSRKTSGAALLDILRI